MFELPGRFRETVRVAEHAHRFVKSTIGTVESVFMDGLWKRVGMGVLTVGFMAMAQQPVGAEELADVDQFRTTSSCVQCDLAGANFDLESHGAAMLSGASLYGTSLVGVDLSYADLSNANLGLAILEGATLTDANLAGANLVGANLEAAVIEPAILASATTDVTTVCPDGTFGPCR